MVRDGKEMPVAFYSRQLRGAEKRYSATELKALAVVAAIHPFLPYLFGRHFSVVTDHQALKALMTTTPLNRRLQGWALKLQNFAFSVVYRAGKENGNADGLSRHAWQPNLHEDARMDAKLPTSSTTGGVCDDQTWRLDKTYLLDAEDGINLSSGGCGDQERN